MGEFVPRKHSGFMRDPPSWDYGATSGCCWVLDSGFVIRETRFVTRRVGQFLHNGRVVGPAV